MDFLKDYQLVWSDDFEGTELDRKKWCLTPHMRAQADLLLYDDERAVKVVDSKVVLTAGRIDDKTFFTNTSLTTSETMIFKYGYVEMKAKIPNGKAAFPSFWMKASTYERSNPLCMSEIDIFEIFGTYPGTLVANCHKWYSDGEKEHEMVPQSWKTTHTFKDGDDAENWHTVAMLWTPEELKFFVDGEVFQTFDISEKNDYGKRGDGMGCHHDYHYLIMNNYLFTPNGAHGYVTGEYATAEDKFPLKYEIDYVRLYQKKDEGDLILLTKKKVM
jgi:beta-glucanase (GH16 family)